MKKDLNKIAQIEKAISKKYGKEAIQNPKSNWNEKKEKKYLADVKRFYTRTSPNMLKKYKHKFKNSCVCEACGKEDYFFSLLDDKSFARWNVCHSCYIDNIQGRPDKESVFEN